MATLPRGWKRPALSCPTREVANSSQAWARRARSLSYVFPEVSATNDHPLGGFKTTETDHIMMWTPKVHNQGVIGLHHLKAQETPPCLCQFPAAPGALGSWPHHSRLCSVATWAPLPVTVSLPSPIRTLLTGFRAHPDHPGSLVSRSLS